MEAACDLVLPCRDEGPALAALLPRVSKAYRVIVVDNGSRDDTADVARSHGATVVTESRAGYGAAVHAGLEAATAEYVAFMDGDGSFDPDELGPLLDDVREGRADLAVGRRCPARSGVWPWHARAGNALVVAWLRHRIGMPAHDIAPMRVSRRRALLDLGIRDRRSATRSSCCSEQWPRSGGSPSTTSPTTRAPRAPAPRSPAR